MFVLKILSRTQRVTEVKIFVGFSLKPLHSKNMALFAYLRHPTAIIAAVFCAAFGRQSFLKLLKRLIVVQTLPGIQLNARQRTSLSLFSVFCPQIFRILPVTRISVARALFRIRASVAPRVLHFSAFISYSSSHIYMYSLYRSCMQRVTLL